MKRTSARTARLPRGDRRPGGPPERSDRAPGSGRNRPEVAVGLPGWPARPPGIAATAHAARGKLGPLDTSVLHGGQQDVGPGLARQEHSDQLRAVARGSVGPALQNSERHGRCLLTPQRAQHGAADGGRQLEPEHPEQFFAPVLANAGRFAEERGGGQANAFGLACVGNECGRGFAEARFERCHGGCGVRIRGEILDHLRARCQRGQQMQGFGGGFRGEIAFGGMPPPANA